MVTLFPSASILRVRMCARVSQKYTFFEFRFVGRITGANGCPEATKKISALQTHKRHLAIDFQYSRGYTRENFQKSIFGHKILQEHATTIQLALLSYIFIALSRDTPLAHVCRLWSDGHMAINRHMAIYLYTCKEGKTRTCNLFIFTL